MVKGVGVVDQALREAFQILKQVLHLRKLGAGGRWRSGRQAGVWVEGRA